MTSIWIDYTNHRGERTWREIAPLAPPEIGWSNHHPEMQPLLRATDIARNFTRTFALGRVHAWSTQPLHSPCSAGAAAIAAERLRQVSVEGWDPKHDDDHVAGEIALAAACYAAPEPLYKVAHQSSNGYTFADPWPWHSDSDKRPRDEFDCLREPTRAERVRMLEKAGALIAAEIDRLLRSPSEAR